MYLHPSGKRAMPCRLVPVRADCTHANVMKKGVSTAGGRVGPDRGVPRHEPARGQVSRRGQDLAIGQGLASTSMRRRHLAETMHVFLHHARAPGAIGREFPVDLTRQAYAAIDGWPRAITIALRNPERYRSLFRIRPISRPTLRMVGSGIPQYLGRSKRVGAI